MNTPTDKDAGSGGSVAEFRVRADGFTFSEQKYDGGPAFPAGIGNGMSLRDWFAGQALAGMVASYAGTSTHYAVDSDAERAYRYADAMLAARGK